MARKKQQESLRLEWRSPAELAENPKNWRRHPESQVELLSDIISDVGWAGACLFNERTGRLIDGHARRKLALEQGCERVPVLVGSWSEEQEAKILATFDPISAMAEADGAALVALLEEVNSDNDGLRALLAELLDAVPVVVPPEVTAQKPPTLASECYVEVYCTRAALEQLQPTLKEWAQRDDCTINIS